MYNSSFPMCFKLPKDTNLKCAKICQKIKKPALATVLHQKPI